MHCLRVLCISLVIYSVNTIDNSKPISSSNQGDIYEQGLYSKADHVVVIGHSNYIKTIFGTKHAMLIQFYNSYCGHCRSFSSKYKSFAKEAIHWRNIIQLGAVDCSAGENFDLCDNFDIQQFPSLRYFHENYKKHEGVGDKLQLPNDIAELRSQLVMKARREQSVGRLRMIPSLTIGNHESYSAALDDLNKLTLFTFLVFEVASSKVGSLLIFDTNDYSRVRVKSVLSTSKLSKHNRIKYFPSIIVVKNKVSSDYAKEKLPLPSKSRTRENLLKAINSYLKSKKYPIPSRNIEVITTTPKNVQVEPNEISKINTEYVFYDDLEKTLHTILHLEVPRHKILQGEARQALLALLDVLIDSYPFRDRDNGRSFITELRSKISSRKSWKGSNVIDQVKSLEKSYSPVYNSSLEFVRCRGSHPQYRGYSCGLWTLFHTLTVNAARKQGTKGPKVLRAIHGYIKNFFGCTDCQKHFQDMAKSKHMFDVKSNDQAIMWLWLAHNLVNKRLAGEPATEDPAHPKLQYPSTKTCLDCRQPGSGSWELSVVLRFLKKVYGPKLPYVTDTRRNLRNRFKYQNYTLLSDPDLDVTWPLRTEINNIFL